jgi:hypothetical protein
MYINCYTASVLSDVSNVVTRCFYMISKYIDGCGMSIY